MSFALSETDILNIQKEAAEWAEDDIEPFVYLQSIYRFVASRCIEAVGLDRKYIGRDKTSLTTAFTEWFDDRPVSEKYPMEIPLLAGAVGRAMKYSLIHSSDLDVYAKSLSVGESFIPCKEFHLDGYRDAINIGSTVAIAVGNGYSR